MFIFLLSAYKPILDVYVYVGDSEEVTRLKTEIEVLRRVVEVPAHVNASAQTDAITDVMASSEAVARASVELETEEPQLDDVFTVRPVDVYGWDGIVPNDLFCMVCLNATDPPTVESDRTELEAESAHTVAPAIVDGRGDRAVFGAYEELELFSAQRGDNVKVKVSFSYLARNSVLFCSYHARLFCYG